VIKDVQVHLDGSPEDELRLQHAEALAVEAQAHLTGLFTNQLADIAAMAPVDGGFAAAQLIADLDEEARRTGDRTQRSLAERFARLAVPSEVRRLEASPGELLRRIACEARWGDLFVASRPYGGNGGSRWDELFESVLFSGGRGIYVVPPGRKPSTPIRRVLVAWRDSRESARAVAEAAPILAKATRTKVLLIDPALGTTSNSGEPGADIARHLSRYGTEVEIEVVEGDRRSFGEIAREKASRLSADLIVMGAYGHSRAREWVLGGATREMLERSEFPLLIAH
jgi:nucleotide-binding universal stress UspA family protein